MKTLNEILSMEEIVVERSIIQEWITEGWLRPLHKKRTYYFEDIDVARIQLIYELHFNMDVSHNSMPIILSLLDQLHGTRAQLVKVTEAIDQQPMKVKEQILKLVKKKS